MVLDCCALPHADERGLRLGTAAVTTQGMGTGEMTLVAGLLASVLRGGTDPVRAREDVRDLVAAFPVPALSRTPGGSRRSGGPSVQPSSPPGSPHSYPALARVWGCEGQRDLWGSPCVNTC